MAISIAARGTPYHDTAAGTVSGPNFTYTMVDGGTPTANILLVAKTCISGASGGNVTSFAGYGLTFTKIGQHEWGTNRVMDMWAALSGPSPTTAAPVLTIDEVGNGGHIVMYEVTLDSYGATALSCFRDQGSSVYIVTTTGTGTTATLTYAAAANSNNRPIAFFEHLQDEVTTERASWTELNDGGFINPSSGAEDQWRSDAFETTGTATWTTSVVYGAMGAEIRAFAASGGSGFQ